MIDQPLSNAARRIIDLTPNGETVSPNANVENRRIGKFILVEFHEIAYLVFGDLSAYRYHANLLHKFCEDRHIESSWVHEHDLLEPRDPQLSVSGGGVLELDYRRNIASFSGASKAYGPFSRGALESILTSDRSLDRLKIVVR